MTGRKTPCGRGKNKHDRGHLSDLAKCLLLPVSMAIGLQAQAAISETRSFVETVGDTRARVTEIGTPVMTGDGDTRLHRLSGDDASNFSIDEATGQIKTISGKRYDHEARGNYNVIVYALGIRDTVTIRVTITVNDVDEPALAPATPSVRAGGRAVLSVSWAPPDNRGRPDITHYDLRHRASHKPKWENGPRNVRTGTGTEITELTADTRYDVQVRAVNSEGNGEWSSTGQSTTSSASEFADTTVSRNFVETIGDARAATMNIGAAVTSNERDVRYYKLGGDDASSFEISDRNGQIRTVAGKRYDHEERASYNVRVWGLDLNSTIGATVTIRINDADEPPLAPKKPSVTATSSTTLSVFWSAPGNVGRPNITHYNLRYRINSEGGWKDGPQNVRTGTSTEITGLTVGTRYDVQVQAVNDEGKGQWSPTGEGTIDVAWSTPPRQWRLNHRLLPEQNLERVRQSERSGGRYPKHSARDRSRTCNEADRTPATPPIQVIARCE